MADEDTHEQLMRLFREYFKENQGWENKKTHVAGTRVRQLLAEIRIIARIRRAEILKVRKQKRYMGSELKTESNRRKAELKKAKQVDVMVSPESTNNRAS